MALQIRRIPIDQVNPTTYNPRVDLQPGDDDYEKLKRSLDEFGCVEPLVWNSRTGNLVGGHQRLKVLVANGASEVDVSVVDLPLEKEKALNIALNKIQGDWDKPRLAALIENLSVLPDFDVSLTGFDAVEVGQLLDRFGSVSSGGEDGFDLADALDAAADLPPVTQKGELIELGPHRLLCGDSAKSEDIQRLLGCLCIHEVDLVFTDPPYNVAYYGGNRPTPPKARPKPSRRWDRIYHDNLSQNQYETWLSGILHNMLSVLAPGAPFYLWNGHRQFGPMHTMLTSTSAHISCVITWPRNVTRSAMATSISRLSFASRAGKQMAQRITGTGRPMNRRCGRFLATALRNTNIRRKSRWRWLNGPSRTAASVAMWCSISSVAPAQL